MKSLRLGIASLCIATLLSACSFKIGGEDKFSANDAKEKLEKQSYVVELLDVNTYKDSEIGGKFAATDGFENYIKGVSADGKDYVYAWYFDKMANADTFFNTNSKKLEEEFDTNPDVTLKAGIYNNVAYVATEAAQKVAGLYLEI